MSVVSHRFRYVYYGVRYTKSSMTEKAQNLTEDKSKNNKTKHLLLNDHNYKIIRFFTKKGWIKPW